MRVNRILKLAGIALTSQLLLAACSHGQDSADVSQNQPKMVKTTKSSEEEQLIVVSEIMEDSYVMVHGDHFHVEEGFVPYKAKFTKETLVPKDYKLDKKDVLYQVEHGSIVKLEDGCFYYPDGETGRKAVMSLKEAKKKTANLELDEDEHHHQHAHSHGDKKAKSGKKKEVAGVTKKTDDGFILESERQITQKTDKGIVVEHKGHSHFIYYKDLKGSKWDYLIPTAKESASLAKAPQQLRASSNTVDDGYVFNPADIVSEDAFGYTVRHGDHFHYISKSSVGANSTRQEVGKTVAVNTQLPKVNLPANPAGSNQPKAVQQAPQSNSVEPDSVGKAPISPSRKAETVKQSSQTLVKTEDKNQGHQTPSQAYNQAQQVVSDATKTTEKVGSPGIDYPTDDGFLFDGTGVVGRIPFGLLVNHNGHTHVLPTEQVKNSKWAYLLEETPSQAEEAKVTLADKLDYISKAKEVDREKLEVVKTEKGLTIRYPHKDHHHTILVADIPKQSSLDEKLAYLAELHQVDLDQLQLTDTAQGQAVIYPHGDHFHTVLLAEVDPSLDPKDSHAKDRVGMNTLKSLGFDDEIIEDLLHATSSEPFPSKETNPEKMKEWLATVTALNIGQRTNPLSRLGLQYLTNLEILGAGFTPISDLTPLYQFPNLKQVWLTQTGVKDYSFMDHLPNLEGIDLSQNGLSDLSFLGKYPQLRVLAAAGNDLTDLSFLSNLPALTSLNLDYNKLTDISPLASLSHLKALSLEHNAIRNLLPVQSPVLERLYVSGNVGIELNTLVSNHLEELEACEVNATDLEFLKSNPNLKDVNLSSNDLTNLAGIEEAKQLERLNISDNQIKELGLEKEQDSLKQLDLSNNQLTSLEGVQYFTSLKELDVHHNELTDLELSKPAESVEILDASENHLKEEDLKPNQNGIPEVVAKNYPNVIAGSVADQN